MTMTEEREVNMGTTDPCRRFPRVRLAATSAAVTSAEATPAEATPAEAGARLSLSTHRTYEADIEGREDPASIIAAQVRQDLRWTKPTQVLYSFTPESSVKLSGLIRPNLRAREMEGVSA